jgi:hypothetical protein
MYSRSVARFDHNRYVLQQWDRPFAWNDTFIGIEDWQKAGQDKNSTFVWLPKTKTEPSKP